MGDGQQGQQRPLPAGFETWEDYWTTQDMPWRIEPEPSDERQRYLTQRLTVEPDIAKGIYPFRDESGSIKLTRADAEWLLASHQSRGVQGPVDPTDDVQLRRDGLDLRGADLKGRNLSGLPLARLNGGLDIGDVPDSRKHDAFGSVRDEAAIHLEGADLSDVHLEAAFLPYAYLDGANLSHAHLDGAILTWAHMKQATLMQATCTGAHLLQAHLERASVWMTHLEAANLGEAHLEGADLASAHLQGAVLNGAHLEGARLSQAHLEGADLRLAHLEGATLEDAHLGGETVSASEVERIRMWVRNFQSSQPAADLREAFFDAATILRFVHLGDAESGWVSLADTHYGGVNLGVVDWKLVGMLGDEWAVRNPKESLKFMQPSIRRYQLQQAVQANRQLAVALSSQGLNEDADRFAYRAQRLQRHLLRDEKQWDAWLWSWTLFVLSGYGHRLWRIVAAYGGVLAAFTIFYWASGIHSFGGESGLQALWDSFLVSLSAIHGRTTFEQLGAWSTAAWVAAIESVFGIVIEGVFVAMLIQRFFSR